ncbi:hypothetical protein BC833DRAFT_571444 [Globomyces pollinis-pini]|nr:hypothetical protein BC833DRAFT_571444 [Globomyces pollinis-pini]
MGQMTDRPKVVRELDWYDQVWPPKHYVKEYPKVQLYCLMGVEDSYTDFHIDFGGSSVYYHILSGEKIFYLIEPTPENLKVYEKWSSSPDQSQQFLGDLIPCTKVHLYAGNTFFIPSGWIHSVFTPVDTVVIGGNFLHIFGVKMQLRIAKMEEDTDVPYKFRFPYFVTMNWFAAKCYYYYLTQFAGITFSNFELESLDCLVNYLGPLAEKIKDMKLEKTERMSIRFHIPEGLNNVCSLISSLDYAIKVAKKERALIPDFDHWESDVSEMEFYESDEDLDKYVAIEIDSEYEEDTGWVSDSELKKPKSKVQPAKQPEKKSAKPPKVSKLSSSLNPVKAEKILNDIKSRPSAGQTILSATKSSNSLEIINDKPISIKAEPKNWPKPSLSKSMKQSFKDPQVEVAKAHKKKANTVKSRLAKRLKAMGK